MGDLIRRQDAIDAIKQFSTDNIRLRNGLMELVNHMELIPSADAVQVVRCKDCVHYHKSDKWHPDTDWCKRLICGTIKPDFYCADGERRSE